MVARAHHHHYTFRHHHPMRLTREVVEAGAIGGSIGGVAMALFATIYDASVGMGFWTPIRAIAATVLGEDVHTGSGVVIVGIAVHLAVSILFGIVFAAIVPREVPPPAAIVFGTFAGLAILVMMSLIVLPILNPTARARLMWGAAPRALPVSVAFVIHLLYGAGLAMIPGLRRRLVLNELPENQATRERSVA